MIADKKVQPRINAKGRELVFGIIAGLRSWVNGIFNAYSKDRSFYPGLIHSCSFAKFAASFSGLG